MTDNTSTAPMGYPRGSFPPEAEPVTWMIGLSEQERIRQFCVFPPGADTNPAMWVCELSDEELANQCLVALHMAAVRAEIPSLPITLAELCEAYVRGIQWSGKIGKKAKEGHT